MVGSQSYHPVFFLVYMDYILKEWDVKLNGGIWIAPNLIIKTMLFVDDQVLINNTELELHKSIYILEQIIRKYNLNISVQKTANDLPR